MRAKSTKVTHRINLNVTKKARERKDKITKIRATDSYEGSVARESKARSSDCRNRRRLNGKALHKI
jgi:hypothetical protein